MKTQSWQKWILILTALSFFTIILLLPLFTVFYSALEQGIGLFFAALKEPEALAAIWLTIKVSLIVLPINIFYRCGYGLGYCVILTLKGKAY